jgi:hypothetical protein
VFFFLLILNLWPSNKELSEYREKKKSDQESKIEELRQRYETQLRTMLPIEEKCNPLKLFYRGTIHHQKPDMSFVWAVQCAPIRSGKNIQVSVKALTGETKYLPCVISAAIKDDCFTPIQ